MTSTSAGSFSSSGHVGLPPSHGSTSMRTPPGVTYPQLPWPYQVSVVSVSIVTSGAESSGTYGPPATSVPAASRAQSSASPGYTPSHTTTAAASTAPRVADTSPGAAGQHRVRLAAAVEQREADAQVVPERDDRRYDADHRQVGVARCRSPRRRRRASPGSRPSAGSRPATAGTGQQRAEQRPREAPAADGVERDRRARSRARAPRRPRRRRRVVARVHGEIEQQRPGGTGRRPR